MIVVIEISSSITRGKVDLCTAASHSDFPTKPISPGVTTLQHMPFLAHELHPFKLNTLGTLTHALTHVVFTLDTHFALTHLALSHTHISPAWLNWHWHTWYCDSRDTLTHVVLISDALHWHPYTPIAIKLGSDTGGTLIRGIRTHIKSGSGAHGILTHLVL